LQSAWLKASQRTTTEKNQRTAGEETPKMTTLIIMIRTQVAIVLEFMELPMVAGITTTDNTRRTGQEEDNGK
jgi:hypothetical protein